MKNLSIKNISITLIVSYFFIIGGFIVNGQSKPLQIRIDPDNTYGGKISDFFERVEFIKLDSKKESIFGNISQLEATKDRFIIYDNDTRSILIFNHHGEFIAKIKPRSSEEFFGSFTLDRKLSHILLNISGNKFLTYDYDGKFIDETQVTLRYERIFKLSNGYYALNSPRNLTKTKKDSMSNDLIFSSDLKSVSKYYFPYNTKHQGYDYNLPLPIFSDQGNNTFFYSFPYSYSIFEMDSDGIIQEYNFVFSEKYSLPMGFGTDSLFSKQRKEYIFNPDHENLDKYTFIGPTYKISNYLIFHVEKISNRIFSQNSDFIHNLQTGITFSLNKLKGDSISDYLPVLQTSYRQNFKSFYDGFLYSTMPSAAYNAMIKNLNIQSDTLQIKNLNNNDNPIIIKIKIKK